METGTPERKREHKERTRDRISDLPDAIGHHILSFLPVELVAQTGVLSKRWRSLWHSFPTLDFTTIYQNRLNHQNQGIPFDSLISSILLNRQQGSNIKLFRLKGFVSSPFLSICLENLASIHQIEELDLEVPLSDPCEIPYNVLSCKSLRALTLKSENSNARFTFSTSYLMDSPDLKSLHTLSLTCVYFTNSPSIHNHFSKSTFPVLKSLCLRDCKGISSHVISCPSLELLEISNLNIKGLGVFCKGLKVLKVLGCFRISPGVQRWVQIIASQLQEIHWADNPSTEICRMGSFPYLRLWTINFPDEVPSQMVLRCMATLLSTPSFTRSLFLGITDISHMAKIDSAGIRLNTFKNLTYLYLLSGLNKRDIPGVACVVRCCPRLLKLKVAVQNLVKSGQDIWNRYDLDSVNMTQDQYWALQFQRQKSMLEELQHVTIEVRGCVIFESTINLVKFLLGFGRVMKTLKITTSLSVPGGPCLWHDWQRKTAQRIKGFKRASPDVKLVFKD